MQRSKYIKILSERLSEERKFIEVLVGARQVGKTTIVSQFLSTFEKPYIWESADDVSFSPQVWLEGIWQRARMLFNSSKSEVVLCIDEIQKVPQWSETVKKLWDEDTKNNRNIKVVLLGSSRLLLTTGLSDSLQGRYELIYVTHWSYQEMKEAFDYTLDEYIYYGGFPGPAKITKNEKRWKNYIRDSIVEPSISKDILFSTKITKPALLKQLFELGSYYSAQVLSYNAMLGLLTDAGNTTTLAGYLNLLNQCCMMTGLNKYLGSEEKRKASSPKLQVYNNAFLALYSQYSFKEAKESPDLWGRFVESTVGMHLVNSSIENDFVPYYWRDGNYEVDYIIQKGKSICAFEVKSGLRITNKGIDVFRNRYPQSKIFVISSSTDASGCIRLEDFLSTLPSDFL